MTVKECSIDGCAKPLIARGWCHFHYYRWRRWGDPVAEGRPCVCEHCNGKWLRTAKGGPPNALCPACSETHAKCTLCRAILPFEDFYLEKGRPGSRCKPCSSEYSRARGTQVRPTEAYQRTRLKSLYGITPEQWQEMFDEQGGRCKICRRDVDLNVDHCHTGGHVRGLLCRGCNTGIGAFADDPLRLAAAIEYLHMSKVGV